MEFMDKIKSFFNSCLFYLKLLGIFVLVIIGIIFLDRLTGGKFLNKIYILFKLILYNEYGYEEGSNKQGDKDKSKLVSDKSKKTVIDSELNSYKRANKLVNKLDSFLSKYSSNN